MLSKADLAAKVASYDAFLSNVLKVDLTKAAHVKTKLQTEMQELCDLEHNLRVLQQTGQTELKTQVDVGSEVLCSAHVPASRVFLSIGLGFHVEASLEEAPRIIGVRKAALESKIQAALDQSARIRAHIKLVEQALGELLSIGPA